MNAIYQCAFCTIVAAHGADANAGLPGVNSKWATDEPKVRDMSEPETIFNFRRISVGVSIGDLTNYEREDGLREVANSGWIKRGWTFQEKICSPRSLIFTESGLIFWCCKCIRRQNFFGWHKISDYHHLEPKLRSFSGVPFTSPNNFEDLLKGYLGRELTHERDRLNAISGVLELVFLRKHSIDDPPPRSGVHGMLYCMPSFGLAWKSDSVISRSVLEKPTWSWVSHDFHGEFISFDLPKQGSSVLSIHGIRVLPKKSRIEQKALRTTLYNGDERLVTCLDPSWQQHFAVDKQELDKSKKFLWNVEPKKYLPRDHLRTQLQKLRDKTMFHPDIHAALVESLRYNHLSDDQLWNKPKYFEEMYAKFRTKVQKMMDTYFVLFFTSAASFTLEKQPAALEWDDLHEWNIYSKDGVRISSIVLPDRIIATEELTGNVNVEFIVVECVQQEGSVQYGIMMVSREGKIYSRVQMAKEYVDAKMWHESSPEKKLIILG